MKNKHTNTLSELVNECMRTENWKKAQSILEKEVEKNPDDHWLLTQLSEVYYELRNYDKALALSTKAIELAPNCPLTINDHALHLYMHEKDKEAIELWQKVLKKGIDQIAYGECGEGLSSSKSLLNDIRMRIGLSYFEIGEKEKSLAYFKEHLKNRQRGIFSNFTKQEVEKRISEIEKNSF